jgi:TetR/AcrR family tetracycline transcriptional repressor
MRRLAAELRVAPNSLYSHFPDKVGLIDALLDNLLGEVDVPDPAVGDWRDGLVKLMDATRLLLLAHPELVAMFVTRSGLGPNAARLGEITFQLLRRGGLQGERAVEAFRVLLIYTMGFAAFQAPRQGGDSAERTKRAEAIFGSLPKGQFPEMTRLAAHLGQHADDGNFHAGLRWLLEGISDKQR